MEATKMDVAPYQELLEMRKKQLEVNSSSAKKTPSPLTRRKSSSSAKTRKTPSKAAKSPPKKLKLSDEPEITDNSVVSSSSPKLAKETNGLTTSELEEKQSKPVKQQPKKTATRAKKATPAAKLKSHAKNTKLAIKENVAEEVSEINAMLIDVKVELTSPENGNHKEPSDSNEDSDESDAPDFSNSVFEGKNLFGWLINPVKTDVFFEKTWEKKPLHIKRNISTYYENVLTTKQIDQILRSERVEFTKNLDITSYSDGQRQTHNQTGRALPHVVWDYYSNGCSVRMINPQSFCRKVHLLCATLQEFFGCMVGANSYLTPPGSQGFAPHYDDIEAFVIQIEGKKHWKLYAPRVEAEILPRTSSRNFSRDEIGKPILDVVLHAGDLLYFPRGIIHEACTLEDEHSLHITVSMYQKHSWADLLEKLIPSMISKAVNENPKFREGLPLDISNHMGIVNSDSKSPRRLQILGVLRELLNKTFDVALFDAAVDQIYKDFQHSALPPVFTSHELACTVYGDGERIKAVAEVTNRVELAPETRIRLLRANIIRMVMEDETIRIYYHVENTTEYQAVEPQFMEVDESQAPAIEYLIKNYPKYVPIASLPLTALTEKIALVDSLWEKGILVTSKPLDVIE